MKINEKNILTNFLDPDGKINSQYGLIDNFTWLKHEATRIGKCRIIKDEIGNMALYRVSSTLRLTQKQAKEE